MCVCVRVCSDYYNEITVFVSDMTPLLPTGGFKVILTSNSSLTMHTLMGRASVFEHISSNLYMNLLMNIIECEK